MDKPLCIYHADCVDGFGAAFAVWLHYKGEVDFYPGVHEEPPPNVINREVFIVDFSYKRKVLFDMARIAKSITLIDHHISAYKDLIVDYKFEVPERLFLLFNMNKSGAVLAWEYFHHTPAPNLFKHIQDRDLWKFELEDTKEVIAALFSYEYDFDLWKELVFNTPIRELKKEGSALHRKLLKDVKKLIKSSAHRFIILSYDVPVLNTPYFMSSEAGHIMGKGEPFAACYWITGKNVHFSLRSAENGVDVSKIAKHYGGGGHTHAAGFSVTRDQFVKEFLNTPDEEWKRLAKNVWFK